MTGLARSRLLGAGAVAVAATAIAAVALGGLGRNLVYYWGPADVQRAGEKALGAVIRLGGKVQEGSVRYQPGVPGLAFAVTDGVNTVPVHAEGMPPQMFREGIGVVVEGTLLAGGTFEGRRLMVSHGNEYRAPKAGEKYDARALIQSVRDQEAKR